MKERTHCAKSTAHSIWAKGAAHIVLAATITLATLTTGGIAAAATITVDASKQTAGNPHFWSAAFGTGKAKLVLRSDWQTHYKIGNRELGAQRVRGHGLLNDEVGLWKGNGSYDWTNLDTYLKAITTANMRPIMELDFMPTKLATSGDKSPPKDYNEWKAFIKALVQHCIDKYGMDDVAKWYWEVWNEPDYAGFWNGTDMNAYYTLYDNTVAAITSVIPNAIVGGPATTNAGPVNAFLGHCKSAGTRVSFVSSHVYPGGANTGTSADAANFVSDNNTRLNAIKGNGYTSTGTIGAAGVVKSFNTEWNSSYSGQGGNQGDAVTSMDNHWNVGFILKAAKLLSDQNSGDAPVIDIFSYWALSDVFDEDGGTDGIHMTAVNGGETPFGTVFGIMTFQGVRKAAFNAFKLLNYLGPKRLQSGGGTGGDGIDAMATTSDSGDSLQILVYNYYKKLNTASGSGDAVTINVSNLPSALSGKKVFVTQFVVDETHSNPYHVWETQNKPGKPSEEQWQAMRAAQHLALMQPTAQQSVDTSFTTTFNLAKQAGTLIIVSAKRPVTGRDAMVEIEGEDYDGQSQATKVDSGDSTTLGQSISVASGGYVYFENVDYTDDGANSVELRVKTQADVSIELHADTQDGKSLGKCAVTSTANAWATQTCTLASAVTGVSKLYLVFGGAANLNWFKFHGGNPPAGTGGTGAGGAGGNGAGGSNKGGAGGNGAGGAAGNGAGGINKGGAGGDSAGGAGGNATAGSNGNAGDPAGSSGGSGGNAPSSSGGSAGSSKSESGGVSGSGGTTARGDAASGCSCRVGSTRGSSGALALLGLIALAFGLRRRK